MSALISDSNRRGAERHSLPKPVAATYGGFNAMLIEFSLTGCRVEHNDRMNPRVSLPLRFFWRGTEVKLQATLVRSEMIPVRGKPGYISGLLFCDSPDDAPPVVRDILKWLKQTTSLRETAAAEPEPETARRPNRRPRSSTRFRTMPKWTTMAPRSCRRSICSACSRAGHGRSSTSTSRSNLRTASPSSRR